MIAPEEAPGDNSKKGEFYRILSLDGGGAKGFYSLGVLREIEGMLGCPLYERFDLVFGTSTGAIIAALIALGYEVDQIHDLYKEHVPRIMKAKSAADKSKALEELAKEVFGGRKFDVVRTGIGIVSNAPMIFKGSVDQAHGRVGTFSPGFGCSIADAVQASCSAYPFSAGRSRTTRATTWNWSTAATAQTTPTLYAIADALMALKRPPDSLRVVSVGVGVYPTPEPRFLSKMWLARYLQSVQLLR